MKRKKIHSAILAGASVLGLAGCHHDMWDQPRLAALQRSESFSNDAGSRLPVEGTMTYDGHRRKWTAPVFAELTKSEVVPTFSDDHFWTGKDGDKFVPDNYFKVTRELLERGHARFEVTCMPCHGLTGDGMGVVAQRGFPNPPSYHIDRLREVEDGYIFDVITHGFGRMYSYAARVKAEDRWAIAAYIRALQYSQNVTLEELTPQEREQALHPKPAMAENEAGEENAAGEHAH